MKVFFDGNVFTRQKPGGISRLSFELIKSLDRFKDVQRFYYRKPGFLLGRIGSFLDIVFMNIWYGMYANKKTIFHSLYYRIPKYPKGPVVINAYDMIHELFGSNQKIIAFKKHALLKSDVIISSSEHTKKDICRLYPTITPQKIVVAYPGVNEIFFKIKTTFQNNSRPYMLYVGPRSYKYKNFNLLLDTFIHRQYFLNFDLVLVGGEKDLTDAQKNKIQNTKNGVAWIRQEFCDDERLAKLYSNATVFIYPSLYEGFGIPPLEAMASGCPVVASSASAVPESVGDSGLLFDPNNADDLAQKIEMILADKVFVTKLIEKGRARAKQFTWNKMADVIYRTYIKLI